MSGYIPPYTELYQRGELEQRIKALQHLYRECRLCPRACGVDRSREPGACRIGDTLIVASWGPHFGEEAPLVGGGGSGTIFLSGCNLHCVYCQNYDISQSARGIEVSPRELAQMMLDLQKRGCTNINFVSPTHVIPRLVEGVYHAVVEGLTLPLVYNSGGYEGVEALQLLHGIIDIYMPDMKYGTNKAGRLYSGVPDYWDRSRAAVGEMYRQVGDLVIDRRGKAWRGMLVRHLVLPGLIGATEEVLSFLAEEISVDTYINIMAQYYPSYRAQRYRELSQGLTQAEYYRSFNLARRKGLYRFSR